MGRKGAGGPQLDGTGQLERLREHEQSLAQRLDAAHAAAARIVEEARTEAEATRQGAEVAAAREADAIRRAVHAEAEARVRRVLDDARALEETLEAVDQGRVEELAEAVFRRLLGAEAAR
ncbi:MAG: hypothetical protein R3304_09335 [Longimicrobiales bacterium]|nr:hypothetical protein [Longimicrobiales bacterium]